MTERGSANYLSAREVYDFRPYTPAVAHATRPLYERVRHVIPEIEWAFFAPYVHEINRLRPHSSRHSLWTHRVSECA